MVLRDACVNESVASGGRRKVKSRRLFLCRGNGGGKERSGEGGERDGRGEMGRREEGSRCESAHTGNFIEGDNRALRTDV